jgi:alkylhydroperoxidase/carboxymuconolactone decarboxylase family protein YurZ
MNKEKILEQISNEFGTVPKPLANLAELDLKVLTDFLLHKKNVYSGRNLDMKTKSLIALAVGIALDSEGCIMKNIMVAKKSGVSTEEIMEAYSIAMFSKSSTAISGFVNATDWLIKNKEI